MVWVSMLGLHMCAHRLAIACCIPRAGAAPQLHGSDGATLLTRLPTDEGAGPVLWVRIMQQGPRARAHQERAGCTQMGEGKWGRTAPSCLRVSAPGKFMMGLDYTKK